MEAESNMLCRKLQLKDMLPVEMQRLVKYPLLLETIAKYTQEPSEEQTKLLNSVNSAKKILSGIVALFAYLKNVSQNCLCIFDSFIRQQSAMVCDIEIKIKRIYTIHKNLGLTKY